MGGRPPLETVLTRLDEQVTLFSPSGGTYSVVALGWSIVRDQGFTLTSSTAPLTYEYEGYYLQTAGLGL